MLNRLNRKSGISLIVLSITIIVMIILASTTIISYNGILEDTLKKDFANEIYSIQKLVESYKFLNGEYPILDEYVLNMDKIEENYRFEFENESIVDGNIKLYVIDLNKCDVQNVKRGNKKSDKDIYVVSKDTGIVYYIDGVVINNMKYYTLTSDLKNEIFV